MATGTELLFCAHHGREYEAGLRAVEADIYWEPDALGETTVEATRES
jgi:hypothetical protein